MSQEQQVKQSQNLILECHKDQSATINDTEFNFTKMTHRKRLKVFSFFTSIQADAEKSQLTFMGSDEFEAIEQIINEHVTVDGALISKTPMFWDDHAQDYMKFIMVAFGVISYPFMSGSPTS